MWHRLFWCATRTSAVYVLDLTTLVSLQAVYLHPAAKYSRLTRRLS